MKKKSTMARILTMTRYPTINRKMIARRTTRIKKMTTMGRMIRNTRTTVRTTRTQATEQPTYVPPAKISHNKCAEYSYFCVQRVSNEHMMP